MPARLPALIARLRNLRTVWRVPLLVIAVLLFAGGTIYAIHDSGLRASDLHGLPLLVLLLAVMPATIAYSAINMVLMAQAARVPLSFRQGVRISVFAQVAELLPIPGGALVRTAALKRAGTSTAKGAELVISFAVLWIACGGIGAGLALAKVGWPAHLLAGGSLAVSLAIVGWLGWRHGPRVALAALSLRLGGVALVAWRLALAFAAIGSALPWLDSAAFAFAAILGSAASIVPAGLGISEALSALLAHPGGVEPAAAFLAAALSRLAGLFSNMLLALCYLAADSARPQAAARG